MIPDDLTNPLPVASSRRSATAGAAEGPRCPGDRPPAVLGSPASAGPAPVPRTLLSRGALALALIVTAHTALAQDAPVSTPAPSPAQDALGVFEAKCVECHGPSVPKPKGGFGYVTDLEKLASDPALVVPGAPDKSEVYLRLVSEDPKERMPPSKAKGGGLTTEQIARVRRWIESGAPSLPPPGTAPSASDGTPVPGDHAHGESLSVSGRVLRWFGKFHPVVVHFPIALLLCAALAEALRTTTKRADLDPVITFCVVTGSGSAVLAAVLGWLAADAEAASGGTLLVHRWLGIAVALASIGAAGWRLAIVRRHAGPVMGFRLLLVANALVTALAGHFGAVLVHGKDHFAW